MKRYIIFFVFACMSLYSADASAGRYFGAKGEARGGYDGVRGGVQLMLAADALPYEDVSDEETEGLVFMLQEEKLARDVYAYFAGLYEDVRVFGRIALSEQSHMNAVQLLLEKYEIVSDVDPVTQGVFADDDLLALYEELTAEGETSLIDALKIGAKIEELDISDLQSYIDAADNQDIKMVYENLMNGSENHLRAFVRVLAAEGEDYYPVYLSQEEYDQIISETPVRGPRR